MGSDNTGKRGRRQDRAPLVRALIAVCGIMLLIWFTAEPGVPTKQAGTRRQGPRKLIADGGGVRDKQVVVDNTALAPAAAQEASGDEDAGVARVEEQEAQPPARAEPEPTADKGEAASPPQPSKRKRKQDDDAEDRPPAHGVYRFTATDIDGEAHSLAQYAGQVSMIVNVASACGYTAVNYAGLQALYAEFAPQGFNVLAFPCDCFGNQEPGSDAEIKAFAHDKYGAEFQLFSKIKDVNGADAHPIFDWLQLQNSCTPTCESPLTWNFNKFLINRNGKPVKRYGPDWDAATIRADVVDLLKTAYEEADAF